MRDLTSRKLIYLKGLLFLIAGTLAAGMVLLESPKLRTALLLVIAIWSFARFYYFVFYVIQHYVDPEYRFAGLWAFVRYMVTRRTKDRA